MTVKQKKYKRVSSLVLWHESRTADSKKVFCYMYRRNCGFQGGEVKPLESHTDSLRRIVKNQCRFPPSLKDCADAAIPK
jgi:hypothetical protein